jgi:hypothetical protein
MNMSHKHNNYFLLKITPLTQWCWAMMESIFVTLPREFVGAVPGYQGKPSALRTNRKRGSESKRSSHPQASRAAPQHH